MDNVQNYTCESVVLPIVKPILRANNRSLLMNYFLKLGFIVFSLSPQYF